MESTVDPWIGRLRLGFEFIITTLVLVGSFLIVVSTQTSPMADSGAAAVVTLVIGYWFGKKQ